MLQYQQSLFATSTNPKVISEAAKMNTELTPKWSATQPNNGAAIATLKCCMANRPLPTITSADNNISLASIIAIEI